MYIIVDINEKNIYKNTCIHRQITQTYIKVHVSIDKLHKYISKYIDPYIQNVADHAIKMCIISMFL